MKGAIIGDILGSMYEEIPQGLNKRTNPSITDDSVLTFAAHEWMSRVDKSLSEDVLREAACEALRTWFYKYEVFGFSPRFSAWVRSNRLGDYGSAETNGCLMRQSPIVAVSVKRGYRVEECLRLIQIFASTTHNSVPAYEAAQKHARLLYSALKGEPLVVDKPALSPRQWREVTRDTFIWDAKTSLDIALSCVYYANSFEQTIDNCIAVGADTDTYAAIAGPLAQAKWGIMNETILKITPYLITTELRDIFLSM